MIYWIGFLVIFIAHALIKLAVGKDSEGNYTITSMDFLGLGLFWLFYGLFMFFW